LDDWSRLLADILVPDVGFNFAVLGANLHHDIVESGTAGRALGHLLLDVLFARDTTEARPKPFAKLWRYEWPAVLVLNTQVG
jgi:hypothetical protein